MNLNGESLLPEEVLYRQKEGFSDGVSCKKRSLFIVEEHAKQFIEENIKQIEYLKDYTNINDIIIKHPDMQNVRNHLLPTTAEQFYYVIFLNNNIVV